MNTFTRSPLLVVRNVRSTCFYISTKATRISLCLHRWAVKKIKLPLYLVPGMHFMNTFNSKISKIYILTKYFPVFFFFITHIRIIRFRKWMRRILSLPTPHPLVSVPAVVSGLCFETLVPSAEHQQSRAADPAHHLRVHGGCG